MQTMLKKAEPIDAVGDVEYESAFSNIAHAVIRKKAPALVQYELGFQLLDRAEDDSKAVGALLYNIGKKLLVIPLVFVNGELKGADAIYLQDDNLYLPLSEEWIKAILTHYQQPLGQGVPRNLANRGYSSPDMHQAYGLRPKYAEVLATWYRAVRDTDLPAKTAGMKDAGLVEFLQKRANSGQITAFVDALRSDPLLAEWYRDSFGFETLKVAAAQAELRESRRSLLVMPKQAAEPRTQLLRYQGVVPAKLAADHQEELVRRGWTIIDKRAEDEKATLLTTPRTLKNPTDSGIYEVLRLDGSFVKALVICRPIVAGIRGKGLYRDGEMCVVVAMDGDRHYTNAGNMDVWVRNNVPERETEGLKGLPSADNLSADSEEHWDGPRYLFLSPDCKDATALFWGLKTSPGNGGSVFSGCISESYNDRPRDSETDSLRSTRRKQTESIQGVVIDDRDDIRPTHTGNGFLRIPGNWKSLKVSGKTLHLGTPQSFAAARVKEASSVIVAGDRQGFVVDSQRYADAGAATWRLVDGFGLSVKAATELLQSAERSLQTAYVKAASPAFPDLLQFVQQNQSPFEGGFSGPEVGSAQVAVEDPQREPPPQTPDYTFIRDMMQQGGQTGLPELTELGGLTSLLHTSSEDRIIDEKLPKLTQAVDAIAQLLLHLYIHTDVFVTRYGKADTKELEAGLKNTLESLGKTLYHLKHRTVSSQPEATLVDQDLRDTTD